jgi:alcohol dehydrogenase YqhD (iron-dependent ADH family)
MRLRGLTAAGQGGRHGRPVEQQTPSDTQALKGIIDAQSLITKRYTLDQSRQAVQDTADRTIITAVIELT